METFLACILDHKSKKNIHKRHTKFNAEKVLKFYAKGSQNCTEIDAEINNCSNFFKRDEKYEIKLPLGREHDFTGSGNLQMNEKSIQNTYKIDA